MVLLQLSKSAKDVPDACVFNGDLDQIQTLAEQEQPESEPKADAIRGAAAIVRRISNSRMRMEAEELKRLHEERMQESMEPISEDGHSQYEWDGIRRRRTLASRRVRAATSPPPMPHSPSIRSPHPPLGMSQFPSDGEIDDNDTNTVYSSITGTLRGRSRTNATIAFPAYSNDYETDKVRSPMHPVPLTEIAVPRQANDDETGAYYGQTREHVFHRQNTEYRSGGGPVEHETQSLAPTPPPHSSHSARRQFSFNTVFRRTPQPTEEERIGLVKPTPDEEPGRTQPSRPGGSDGPGGPAFL